LAKRVRFLENILNAARDLLEMINGLLEMAKIEAGKYELRIEKVNVHDTCEALAGLIFPLASTKGIKLNLEIASDLPLIETDAKKFRQIVFNFLSNAVKFSPTAEEAGTKAVVTLRAERLVAGRPGEQSSADADRVRISVIDNGPGIAIEDQGKIFEKFSQLSRGHTKEHAGTGLGLTICKELAGVLQGELQLVSDLGRGAMFSLMVPVALDTNRLRETEAEAKFRGALKRATAVG
jgi:signal transduction histidine kinase